MQLDQPKHVLFRFLVPFSKNQRTTTHQKMFTRTIDHPMGVHPGDSLQWFMLPKMLVQPGHPIRMLAKDRQKSRSPLMETVPLSIWDHYTSTQPTIRGNSRGEQSARVPPGPTLHTSMSGRVARGSRRWRWAVRDARPDHPPPPPHPNGEVEERGERA